MIFDSLSAFIQMDGHGLYVWAAYGITLAVLTLNLWWPGKVRAGFIRAEKRIMERDVAGQARDRHGSGAGQDD